MHSTILNMLGVDNMPRNIYQTVVGSIGLFIGLLIKANIFGELSLIFSELGLDEKKFQQRISKLTTAMIHLALPLKTQVLVKGEQYQIRSSLRSQNQFKTFLHYVSPSLRFKVFHHLYKNYLVQNHFLCGRLDEID